MTEFRQHAEYSERADAVYVYLTSGMVERTQAIDDHRNIDYDAAGGVVGIEFLGVSAGVDLREIPFGPTIERLIQGHNFLIFA